MSLILKRLKWPADDTIELGRCEVVLFVLLSLSQICWCNDDDNRDILYKNNGEERYPDFKLYKMISRKVHNHKPINELQNSYFDKFIVPKKAIKKGSFIWNIDELEHQ